MRVLIIDNYDSFTYNLVQYLGEIGASSDVVRNDAIAVAELGERGAEALVISPGPRTPNEAGISVEAVRHYAGKLPILGVCLGHQSIAAAFGGRVCDWWADECEFIRSLQNFFSKSRNFHACGSDSVRSRR